MANLDTYSNDESSSDDDEPSKSNGVADALRFFGRKIRQDVFEQGVFTADAPPRPIDMNGLSHLHGAELIDATVGPLLIMGLRKLVKIRPPRPREWLAFFILSRKGEENDSSKSQSTTNTPS